MTFGAFNETGPLSWAPDGSYIVATGNRSEDWRREPVNTELYRISVTDGAITQLTQRNGPDTSARVSPDGKTIAYLSFQDKFMGYQNLELNVMNADASDSRSLTATLDDLISSVDAAIAQGFVDPDNLFVTGGSGGGVLTAWIVGKTTRFKAAATQKPVINWTSTVLTTDITMFMPKYWFAKLPWEDPDAYWARSPLSLVGSVKTPTLVVVGDQDFRTPLSDSEQYYEALQLQGVPTGLVKVPGASHGGLTARPSQSAAKASAILAWFERYKGK